MGTPGFQGVVYDKGEKRNLPPFHFKIYTLIKCSLNAKCFLLCIFLVYQVEKSH